MLSSRRRSSTKAIAAEVVTGQRYEKTAAGGDRVKDVDAAS
jgi:hypothetical protein